MPRFRSRGFPSRGKRRAVTWVGQPDQGYTTIGANAKVLIASFDPSAAGLPKPTIVRSRGQVSIRPPVSTSTDAAIVGAYGLGIVSDQAFGVGITAIPGPWSRSDWDGWVVWRSFAFMLDFYTGAGVIMASIQQEVDSKGMRKMSDNETLVFVAESQAVSFDISMNIRTLFKLS